MKAYNYEALVVPEIKGELPRILTQSTFFFGHQGCGKTSMLSAVHLYHMADLARYYKALEKIKQLNLEKNSYAIPEQEHICFSNFSVKARYRLGADKKSFDFDPYKWMMPNEDFEYELITPYSVFSLNEAQIYYNSYNYKEIPDAVLAAHQNRRHIHVIFNMDAQRPIQVAAPIRDLYTCFVRPLKIKQDKDENGYISKTTFYYIEFDSWASVERFINENGETDEPASIGTGKIKKYTFEGNIFNCYNSYENEKLFITDKSKKQTAFTDIPPRSIGCFKKIEKKKEKNND